MKPIAYLIYSNKITLHPNTIPTFRKTLYQSLSYFKILQAQARGTAQ